jgi:signal peptidase I
VTNSEDVRTRLEARVAARRSELAGGTSGGPSGIRSRASRRRRLPAAVRFALRLVLVLIAAGSLAIGLRVWVVQPFWIPSASMEPTLHGCPGCQPDRLLVDKLSYHLHSIKRGDVVVFKRPSNVPTSDADLVKRVIGLPGDSIRASGGVVFIDNHALTEPYVNKDCNGTTDFGPTTVPAGDLFVMGDNRCDSLDSRSFGPIATSTIIGRAFVIVWPLPRIHWL